jgi:hypothetical protein
MPLQARNRARKTAQAASRVRRLQQALDVAPLTVYAWQKIYPAPNFVTVETVHQAQGSSNP